MGLRRCCRCSPPKFASLSLEDVLPCLVKTIPLSPKLHFYAPGSTTEEVASPGSNRVVAGDSVQYDAVIPEGELECRLMRSHILSLLSEDGVTWGPELNTSPDGAAWGVACDNDRALVWIRLCERGPGRFGLLFEHSGYYYRYGGFSRHPNHRAITQRCDLELQERHLDQVVARLKEHDSEGEAGEFEVYCGSSKGDVMIVHPKLGSEVTVLSLDWDDGYEDIAVTTRLTYTDYDHRGRPFERNRTQRPIQVRALAWRDIAKIRDAIT